ncbi:MAG: glycosyltransferase [Clostridiaceae bacterium]|nr:glycosyltransferase [Clostridiaceae bacterium]
MKDPLVSIIIPVYNAAPYLPACLETVRRQRYENIEILLVNDGSSDSSPHLCDMYARVDSRIKVVDKPNGGVSSSRNLAIEQAQGTYLQFADSDDWLDRNATRLLVERALETSADLVISHFCRVNGDKITVSGFLNQYNVMDQHEFAKRLMEEPASFYYGVMWNKLYRKDIILSHNIRCSETLRWSEDFLFNLEYIRYAERFAALETPIYYYRKNEKSITNSALTVTNTVQTKLELFDYYKALYTDLGLYEQYRTQIHKYLISAAKDG